MLPNVLALIAFAPVLVSAALFPKDTKVILADQKTLNKDLKQDRTVAVAFVAPWCGHCQKMAPEWSRAAASLHPLIPLYAVDCDAQQNKQLCSQEGIQGFPTVKLFPRGRKLPPLEYNSGSRTAKALVNWITEKAPSRVKLLSKHSDVGTFVSSNGQKPRALLLTQSNKVPLLWHVLSNMYIDRIVFASHRDQDGNAARSLVHLNEDAGKDTKVIVFEAGSEIAHRYPGATKFEPLSEFFDSVLEGTANLPRHVTESATASQSTATEASQQTSADTTRSTAAVTEPVVSSQDDLTQTSVHAGPSEGTGAPRDEF